MRCAIRHWQSKRRKDRNPCMPSLHIECEPECATKISNWRCRGSRCWLLLCQGVCDNTYRRRDINRACITYILDASFAAPVNGLFANHTHAGLLVAVLMRDVPETSSTHWQMVVTPPAPLQRCAVAKPGDKADILWENIHASISSLGF